MNAVTDPQPIILDVRTPEEYQSGHLDGAQLVNFLEGDVHAAIPQLDPTADYLVYCKSGGRSGQAVELMQQSGFTSAVNLGGLEDAAETTGIAIVR